MPRLPPPPGPPLRMTSLHRTASLLLLGLAAPLAGAVPEAGPSAGPAVGPSLEPAVPTPSQAQEDDRPKPQADAIAFAELAFSDAVSRAERLDKYIVIVWHNAGGPPTAPHLARIFEDQGVITWVRENAIAVRINADQHANDARKNGVGTEGLPVVDIFDVKRGGRVERLTRESGPMDLLASVFGIETDGEVLERPVNGEETEPFVWLAWANRRYRSVDDKSGDDACFGYSWCLHMADRHRPGFRARYLDFLLRRVAESKLRSMESVVVLSQEQEKLANKMRRGEANRRDVYEIGRVNYWYRKPLQLRDLFIELGGRGPEQDQYRRWLLTETIGVLGRFQQYEPILEVLEHDPVGLFRRRAAELELPTVPYEVEQARERAAAAPGEAHATDDGAASTGDKPQHTDSDAAGLLGPLEFAEPDTRADLIHDASWAFEALLAVGRGADAAALKDYILGEFPSSRSYGLFVERAQRLKLYSLAVEIAETGMGILDERGRKRMQRLLNRMPIDGASEAPSRGGENGGQDGDDDDGGGGAPKELE